MKKKYFLSFFLITFLSTSAFTQKLNTDLFKKMKARSIGPAVMSGRITAVDAVWENPNIIYAASASGGVWKSENGGTKWQPIFDNMPLQNIGSIAIQQSNPSVIWVGTGEGNPRNSINLGAGIYKSLDGGKTWKLMGLEKTRNIHRILIDPTNPNVIYAGVIGNPYAEQQERGVYKTTDGGETWQRVLFTNEKSGVADMIMDAKNPNKLFVAMWQHKRTAWDFKSGGEGSGLYVTYDAGKNWKKLSKTDGLPEGDFGRIGLASCRSYPNRVYALIEATKNGLYRSDDGGIKWEKVNEDPKDVTNRPFYFNDILCDPKNENRLYSLYQVISVSEDGGKSFKITATFDQAHADHHAIWIHPEDNNLIINGNDGGVSISRDRGKTWTFAEALPLGQFYHVNVDNEIPYNIYGGLQDNGSWQGPAYIWKEGGIRNYSWLSVNGGDGFDVMPDPEDARYGYAMSQGGFLGRYDTKTGQSTMIRPPQVDIKTRLRFNWNAAIAQDPFENGTIYYGSQYVHKSQNKGLTWDIISPDLTINNLEQQKQDQSGGLSLDITSAENHNTILTLAPSLRESGVLWAGTDDGNVQLTRDFGKKWFNLTSKIKNFPKEGWICQIQASKYNAGEAFVTVNNYRQGDFAPYVFRTKDFGQNWERIVDENKVRGYALCFLQDPTTPNLMFCGTEHGLWVSLDDAKTWTQWKAGLPSVSTMDLTIQEREADLIVGTFGRALYVLDDIRPLRKIAQVSTKVLDQKLAAFESPDAYLVEFSTQIGYNTIGDGMYEGENRAAGARISYFVNVPKKEDKKPEDKKDLATPKVPSVKYDTVYAKIYDEVGKQIRTIFSVPDTSGMQRMKWNLTEKGIRYSNTPKPKKGTAEPSGINVLPGKYKVVLSFGDQQDSTYINVKPDPRYNFDRSAEVAKRDIYERLKVNVSKLTEATDRLTEANDITEKLLNQVKDSEGKEIEDFKKQIKAVQDTIKAKRELIVARPLEKQGYGRPNSVTALTKAQELMMYLGNRQSSPSKTESIILEQFDGLTRESIVKINAFFASNWLDFRKKVESMKLNMFKDYEMIR